MHQTVQPSTATARAVAAEIQAGST